MSSYITPAGNLSEAWLRTLEHVVAAGGHAINVISTVENPLAPENSGIRSAVDAILAEGDRKKVRIQPVDTVAGTIFPRPLRGYRADLPRRHDPEELAKLDASAADLYTAYGEILPLLCTDGANSRGTYFGRMVSWPGKTGGGTDQISDRVARLRRSLNANENSAMSRTWRSAVRPNSSTASPEFRSMPPGTGASAASRVWYTSI